MLQAQYIKSYIGPSPNAAGLGTYGQIPVSEYSGVPNIQIPLYSVETEGFSMPITLSYHAGAIKNSDDASWVGLGWSLNAGGVITRSKRDQNDFGTNGFYRTTSSRGCGDNVDQEPDMFYYNIGNKSGKFMILGPSTAPTIRYFTRDNIKLTYNQYAETWTLVTGEGVIYHFEKPEYATETRTGASTGTESYISSWYVTSIELVNGTRIKFSYLTPDDTKFSKQIVSGDDDVAVSWYPAVATQTCCYDAMQALVPSYSRTTTTIDITEVILSKIEFPNGVIKLNAGSRTDLTVKAGTSAAKKLDNIQVFSLQDGNENLLKTFSLNYDYYYRRSYVYPPVPGSCLRLLNVRESTPAATFKPYALSYYGDTLPSMSPGSTSFLGTTGILRSVAYPTGGSSIFLWEPVQFTDGNWTSHTGARIKKIYDRDQADSFNVRRFEYTGGKLLGTIRNGLSTTYSNSYVINSTCCNIEPVLFSYTRQHTIFADFSTLGETTNGNVFGHDKVITWFGENGENGKKEAIFENTAPVDPNYYQGLIPVPVPLNVSNKNGLLKEEWEYRNDNGTFTLVRRLVNTYASADIVTTPARRFAFGSCSWVYNITTEWVQQTDQVVYTYDMSGANPVAASTHYTYDDPDNALPTGVLITDSKLKSVAITNYYAKQKSATSGGIYTTLLNRHIISPVIEQEKSRNAVVVSKNSTIYKDWYNNGKMITPEIVQQKKGANAAETAVRYYNYDEHGNVLALSKEKGKTVSYIWGYGNAYPIAEITNAAYDPVVSNSTQSHNVNSVLSSSTTTSRELEPFTTNYGQTYNFSIQVMLISSGTFDGTVQVQLINDAGASLFTYFYYGPTTYTGSVTLPNGTGSYHFSTTVFSPGAATYMVAVTSTYQVNNTTYNFFHTSFEDLTSGFISDSKTGKKCVRGPYTISTNRKPGNYIASWWQKPAAGGNWVHQEQLIAIAAGSADLTVGAADVLIDEVRLYPQDAFMTTYTYQPQVGMTSKCDERGQVTYYEYDALNRLKAVRDNNNNIVKIIEYNYKSN